MARRVKIKTVEDHRVHFDMGRNEYTLCGLDTMGDTSLMIGEAIQTAEKVDCPTCLHIVSYCRAIKKSECKS